MKGGTEEKIDEGVEKMQERDKEVLKIPNDRAKQRREADRAQWKRAPDRIQTCHGQPEDSKLVDSGC